MSLKDIAAWNGYEQENAGTSCSSCGSSNEEQEPQAPASCTDTPEEELIDPSSCAASCTAE